MQTGFRGTITCCHFSKAIRMCLPKYVQTPPFMLRVELHEHEVLKDLKGRSYKAMQNHTLTCLHEFNTTYSLCFTSSLCHDCLHLTG